MMLRLTASSRRPCGAVAFGLLAGGCALASKVPPGAAISAEDKAAIVRLYDEAARSLTGPDVGGWVSAFAGEAVFQPPTGETMRGPEAIRAWATALPAREHVEFGDLQFTADANGNVEAASAYLLRYLDTASIAGRQFATLGRSGGAWRFSALTLGPSTWPSPPAAQAARSGPAGEIAATVLAGFAGWLLVQGATYLTLRRRLSEYLVAELNTKMAGARQNLQWFDRLNRRITAGTVPDDAPRYQIDALEAINSSRDMMMRYLTKAELQRVATFVGQYAQAEFLFEGISKTVGDLSKRQLPSSPGSVPAFKPLSTDEAEDVHDRFAMAKAIVERWPTRVDALKRLPDQ